MPSCLYCGTEHSEPGAMIRSLCMNTCYQKMKRSKRLGEFPRRITPQEIAEASVDRYLELRERMSSGEACEKLGVKREVMQQRLLRRGLGMRGGKPGSPNSYDDLAEKYWVLVANNPGISMRDAADRLGVHERTLYRAKKTCKYDFEEFEW